MPSAIGAYIQLYWAAKSNGIAGIVWQTSGMSLTNNPQTVVLQVIHIFLKHDIWTFCESTSQPTLAEAVLDPLRHYVTNTLRPFSSILFLPADLSRSRGLLPDLEPMVRCSQRMSLLTKSLGLQLLLFQTVGPPCLTPLFSLQSQQIMEFLLHSHPDTREPLTRYLPNKNVLSFLSSKIKLVLFIASHRL